jgi:hypothetical protein
VLAGALLLIAAAFVVFDHILLNADRINHVASDEAGAVGSLRTLDRALVSYARAHPKEGYPTSLAELTCTAEEWCVDPTVFKKRFDFVFSSTSDQRGGVRDRYQLLASPGRKSNSTRSFFVDESGVIRYGYGHADANSAELR